MALRFCVNSSIPRIVSKQLRSAQCLSSSSSSSSSQSGKSYNAIDEHDVQLEQEYKQRAADKKLVTPWTLSEKERELSVNLRTMKYRNRDTELQKELPGIMASSVLPGDTVQVPESTDITPISGVPEEHITGRTVRIYCPTRSPTQSGSHSTKNWQLEFDSQEKWENPLMGWSSSADPLSSMSVSFSSKEQAIEFCQRNGWQYYVEERRTPPLRPKSYGANFSWDKRTRRSTK